MQSKWTRQIGLAVLAVGTIGQAEADQLWYSRMDGDATAVFGADGVAAGSPIAAEDRDGSAGGAVAFDGADDFYSIGNLGALSAGSMSAWVRLESLDDNQGVVAAGAYGGIGQVYFSLLADDKENAGTIFWRCDLDDGIDRRYVHSDSAVALNQWQHLAVTFTAGDTLRMYVNGIEQTDLQGLAGDQAPYVLTADGLVGSANGTDRALEGRIDDVAIWDEQVAPARIALIHGFGLFHGLPLDSPEIDDALALDTEGETLAVGDSTWTFASALPGPTGTTGGSLAAQDAFIVLNGTTGHGLRVHTGPITAPAIVNLPAANITAFSADVGGDVTDTGNQAPQVTLFYGPSDGGTDTANWAYGVALGTRSGAFTVELDTLEFGTTYFYRCFAENSAGEAWAPGSETFVTTDVTPPTLGSVVIRDITGFAASVEGVVSDTGGYAPEIAVFYGTTNGGTNAAAWAESVSLGGQQAGFSTPLAGLQPDTRYYLAIRAVNPAGTVWTTPSESFTTLDQVPVWINEFMAANSTTVVPNALPDRFDDWIELHNASAVRFDLTGWYLTDDPTRPAQWPFPPGTSIPADGYLVVFASNDGDPDANGNLHTSFKLSAAGEYIGLIRPDLAVASEFGPAGTNYPDQDPDVSYGLSPDDRLPVYFETPTPRAANDPSGFLPVADTRFSPDRGFYDHPISVTITSATINADIHYTRDGSEPTRTSPLYNGPIAVDRTTVLRARAYKDGLRETDVDTHTYLLMDSNPADPHQINHILSQAKPPDYPNLPAISNGPPDDYSMDPTITQSTTHKGRLLTGLHDIPSISIALQRDDFVGTANGIYSHPNDRGIAWERACSAELLDPAGDLTWQADCGLRVQGGASRIRSPKHALSLRFRDIYGPTKLREKVFPESDVEEFNVLALRTGYNNAWVHIDSGQRSRGSMTRDQWIRDAMREMGNPAAGHGYLVHLYINGLYWGVFNLAERQDASHYASYNGGDDETLFARNGSQWVDGDPTAANQAWNAMKAVVSGGNWPAIQQVLDIDNYIDYQIINRFGGNDDLKSNGNWRAAGGGPSNLPWQVYCWDSERTLEDPISTTKPLDPVGVRGTLENQTEYKVRFGDRLHKHFFNQGALTPQRNADRWLKWATWLDRAIVAESARWGDYRRETHAYTRDAEWITEQSRLLNSYFPTRSSFVLNGFEADGLYPTINAPTLEPFGGPVTQGTNIVIRPSRSGTLVYTTDGSDPRLVGGAVNPTAATTVSPANHAILYTQTIKARMLLGGQWSALTEAVFRVGAEDLRVTEIMYHPDDEVTEFIELLNTGDQPLSLYDVQLTSGVRFDFTGSAVTMLGPGERVLVVRDETAFAARYGSGLPVAGAYQGQLDDDGETVVVRDAEGTNVVVLAYNDGRGWPTTADGAGHALVPRDWAPSQQDEILSYGGHWRAGARIGGSPGLPDPVPAPTVQINEIQAHTDHPAPWFSNDAVELVNTTGDPVSLNHWYLSDDVADLAKWAIPASEAILGTGWVVFDEVDDFNNPAGSGFGLSKGGETLFLSYLPGTDQDRVADAVRYPGLENAISWGRYPDGAEAWTTMPETLGLANRLDANLDVRITEVMYNPPPIPRQWEDNILHEFIELHNPTASAIPLANDTGSWRVSGGVSFQFDPAASLGAGQSLLLVNFDPLVTTNRLSFLGAYGLPDGTVTLLGPYDGKLSNRGDRISLERPLPPDTPEDPATWVLVDEVIYFDQGEWPTEPDGLGSALSRVSNTDIGNLQTTWTAAPPTPGSTGSIAPPVLSIHPEAGSVILRWWGPPTTPFILESKDSIHDPSWTPMGTYNGGDPADVTDPYTQDIDGRFFRLRVGP